MRKKRNKKYFDELYSEGGLIIATEAQERSKMNSGNQAQWDWTKGTWKRDDF